MKILDRIKTWLALNRLEGAAPSYRRSNLFHGFASARFDATKSERVEVVRKSRWFEYNSPIANRLADIFEAYTVGIGINITPTSSDPEFNRLAAESFRRFAKYPCINSRMSFAQFQSLCARRWFFDGEVFVLLTRESNGFPRVQMIETHLVNTPPELSREEGSTIIDGVQIDRSLGGRPIGYFIGQEDANGSIRYGKPISSDFVIHIHEPWRANEYRGLPFFTPVINLLHDLDDLHMYEMQAAKDAAATTIFIKTASGEIKPTFLRAQRIGITKTLSDGQSVQTTATQYYEDVFGGKAKVLRSGDDVSQYASQRPSVVTQQYWRMVLEHICNGIGVPYVLAFPESLQGTTYRGTLAMATGIFRARYSVLAEAWSRIYEHYIRWAVASDPIFRSARIPVDFWAHSMRPPRAPDVDVGRSSAAMLAELEAGATNYDLIYSPLGLDWREEFRKLREQQEFARSIGLVLPQTKIVTPENEQ